MIIAILNQKGGVGKTTLATNIAYALQNKEEKREKVLLVNTDPQGSTSDWCAAAKNNIEKHPELKNNLISSVELTTPSLEHRIKKYIPDYKWIVVDGVPQLSAISHATIRCSDVILIPIKAGQYDVWAIKNILDYILVRKPMPKIAFIMSDVTENTRSLKELKQVLETYQLPIFKSYTVHRQAYIHNIKKGHTVFETNDRKARSEIIGLVNELKEFIYAR